MSLDLNPDQYAEPLVCSYCSEPATVDDPTWLGLAVHPECVDMEQVSRAVWTGYPTQSELEEAAVLFGAALGQAVSQLKALKVKKAKRCDFCMGAGQVRVGPERLFAVCSCVGSSR